MRNMLFVSHANPEDNDFAMWLSLRLAAEGYGVWCDLTKLLGGERFWSDIEDAIRNHTIKFLYVLSRTSNHKPSPRDELELAHKVQRAEGLQDFVVPLWIDDLPSAEFNVRLTNINAVPFRAGWGEGLAQLLTKFEKDQVSKHGGFGPSAVATWWRDRMGAGAGVRRRHETLRSNLYPIKPLKLYFHKLRGGRNDSGLPGELPFPGSRFKDCLVSFAPATDFTEQLGPGIEIVGTNGHLLGDRNPPRGPRPWSFAEERGIVTQVLNQAWHKLLTARSLPLHDFAGGATSLYFTKGMLPEDRVWHTTPQGSRSWRNVIGHKTMSAPEGGTVTLRYWHFSLQAKPVLWPRVGFVMKPHVLFSDDGTTIWDSADRLHRARRSQCRDWWNDKWRDLIAGSVAWLAGGKATVRLEVGSNVTLEVHNRPIPVTSPVSYDESGLPPLEEVGEYVDEVEELYEGDEDLDDFEEDVE